MRTLSVKVINFKMIKKQAPLLKSEMPDFILKFITTSLYPKNCLRKKAKSLIKIQMNGYQIKFAIEIIGELSYNNSIKIYLR